MRIFKLLLIVFTCISLGIASGIATFFLIYFLPVPFVGMEAMIVYGALTALPGFLLGIVVMVKVGSKVYSLLRVKLHVDAIAQSLTHHSSGTR